MEQAPTIPSKYRTGLNPGVQSIAAQVPADVFEVLYGGARGGGKSYLGRYWLVDPDYITNAHYRGLVLRKDAVDLADWIDHADQQWRAYGLRFHFNAMRNEFVFASGAKIVCGHMHTDNAYTKYQGNEYQKILFEEATQIPSMELYNMIRSSCRSAYAELKPQIMLTANPGGIGHSWVKAYFVEPSPPMHIITQPVEVAGKTVERKRIYIPATVDDNPHLIDADPMYVANTLEPLKESNPALYKAWRFGDWDVFMGQAFAEWRQTRDGRPWHVIRALPPEVHLEQCQIYIGFDWGWRDPTSFHWVAITPEDIVGTRHVYCYREMTGNETTPETWAQLLADVIATEPITALVMPHDAYYNKNDTNTIESRFEREFQRLKATRYPTLRVPMQFAESGTYENRIGRQTLLHELLATAPDGRPYLQIMDSCRNLIRTLPMLPYSQTKPETVEDKPGTPDHWYDSLTYALYYANLQTSLRGDKRKNVESPYAFDLDNTIQRNANRFRNLGNDWRTL